MESFSDKKMDFKFKRPGAGSSEAAENESPAMPAESDEPVSYSPDELGTVVAEAIKSGSGEAVYEAICRIIDSER